MRKKLVVISASLLVMFPVACSGQSGTPDDGASESASMALETDEQKTLYALGRMVAQSLGQFDLSAEELELVKMGLEEGVTGTESKVDMNAFGQRIQGLAQSRAARMVEHEKEAGMAFLAEQAEAEGAESLESGLIFTELVAGGGPNPSATDRVKVHYHGTLRDGSVFDSSVDRGTPVEFGLNQVIACWTEGVQKIKVGGKARLVCPAEIAYGDTPRPPKIPGGATLVFEVELIEITTPEPAG